MNHPACRPRVRRMAILRTVLGRETVPEHECSHRRLGRLPMHVFSGLGASLNQAIYNGKGLQQLNVSKWITCSYPSGVHTGGRQHRHYRNWWQILRRDIAIHGQLQSGVPPGPLQVHGNTKNGERRRFPRVRRGES
jgi:hypothetical protein